MVYRNTQEAIVDIRTRLLTDVISNIRAVKLYAYEGFFGKKVSDLRDQEMEKLQKFGFVRSLIMSTFGFLPILAAVCELRVLYLSDIVHQLMELVTFIVYGLIGNELNPAIIFSGLQFFNVLRMPISELPMILTSVIDAVVALRRIGGLLVVRNSSSGFPIWLIIVQAEELRSGLLIEDGTSFGVDVQGSFQFDAIDEDKEGGSQSSKTNSDTGITDAEEKANKSLPFSLPDIHLAIPKGPYRCNIAMVLC